MSTMGLIALVLAALIVAAAAAIWWTVRRPVPDEATTSPRTVADLVRLRAEQGAPVPAAAEVQVAPAAAGVEPPAVAAVAEPVEAVPDVDVPEPPAPGPVVAATVPAPAPTGSDTPWGRAARMAGGDGAVWATGEPDREWSDWADWADVDASESGVPVRPEPAFRPVVLPAVSPDLFGTRAPEPRPAGTVAPPVPEPPTDPDVVDELVRPAPGPVGVAAAARPLLALVTDPVPARPVLALVTDEPAAPPSAPPPGPDPDDAEPAAPTEEDALRRRTPAEIAAEQAAADLALLRTFGCAPDPSVRVREPDDGTDDEDDAPLVPAVAPAAHPPVVGAAQLVAFRVVGRSGDGIEGAGVTLLDDQGRHTTGAEADAKGRGEVRAPHPGSYVLVSAAPGHQPGAVAVTVADGPVEAEVLLARSASVAGTVSGEDGPIVGARLTLVQDGEIVDTTGTGPDGEYWIADLAAGDYGLSVTAAECEPVAVLLSVPDETDLRHDVELVPAGLPADPASGSDDDVMSGRL